MAVGAEHPFVSLPTNGVEWLLAKLSVLAIHVFQITRIISKLDRWLNFSKSAL
jgi:hypothetical protein